MGRIFIALMAVLLLLNVPVPKAKAAELTTEQKFQALKEKDIFAGFSDGSSGLYQSMTREQFAQVLYKLLDIPAPVRLPTYRDVNALRWSFHAVEAVSNAGLMLGVGKRLFEPETPVTVEQLGAVLVRAYGWTGDSPIYVSGKVSNWARPAVGIAVQRQLIPEIKDYTVPATRGLLVEASYAVYIQTHKEPFRVQSVVPTANQILRINLSQPVSSADKSRFSVRDVLGVDVNVQQAVLSPDGLTVTLTTDRQAAGRSYALYIDGNPWTYTAVADDTSKPTVSSFNRNTNSLLEVVFSEPVDWSTANNWDNYSLSGNLKITALQVSDGNRRVTISTSRQNDGTTYRLTIRNVKDQAGNVMDSWSVNFTTDSSTPKASFRFNPSTAQITVTFNEKVNPQIAGSRDRYSIDKGLSVVRADLAEDGKTVTLTTSQQNDATIYTLTVSGIPDLAGNMMERQTYSFGGVANPSQPIQLQSVSALNENMVQISFNRAITDDEIAKLNVVIIKDNGVDISKSGWPSFERRFNGGDRTISVQFRTGGDNNPSLFKPGHVYTVHVSGIAYLVTANYANEMPFAGTSAENVRPYVKEVVPLGKKSVKILFSEPVKNVSTGAFIVRNKDGDLIKIAGDDLNNTNAIVSEVVIRFSDELQAGQTYIMTFRSGTVTDAPGWNGFLTKNGQDDYSVSFRGV